MMSSASSLASSLGTCIGCLSTGSLWAILPWWRWRSIHERHEGRSHVSCGQKTHVMDPQVNHGDGEKRVEAGDETFPADHQAAVLPLEPRTCSRRLEARDVLFEGAPTRLFGVHDLCG